MRKKGLEPPRREAPDPKSGAATNYATSASLFPLFGTAKVAIEFKTPNYILIFFYFLFSANIEPKHTD